HSGPALAFDSYDAMAAAMERDDLEATPDHVIVLKNAGPVGGPGMPEWGMLPIPTKLLKRGVRDMLRLSDARMSGTSYGACILPAVRRVHPARRPGSRHRGAAGAGGERRHDRGRCARPPPASRRARGGAGPPPRRLAPAAAAPARLRPSLLRPHHAGARGLRLR